MLLRKGVILSGFFSAVLAAPSQPSAPAVFSSILSQAKSEVGSLCISFLGTRTASVVTTIPTSSVTIVSVTSTSTTAPVVVQTSTIVNPTTITITNTVPSSSTIISTITSTNVIIVTISTAGATSCSKTSTSTTTVTATIVTSKAAAKRDSIEERDIISGAFNVVVQLNKPFLSSECSKIVTPATTTLIQTSRPVAVSTSTSTIVSTVTLPQTTVTNVDVDTTISASATATSVVTTVVTSVIPVTETATSTITYTSLTSCSTVATATATQTITTGCPSYYASSYNFGYPPQYAGGTAFLKTFSEPSGEACCEACYNDPTNSCIEYQWIPSTGTCTEIYYPGLVGGAVGTCPSDSIAGVGIHEGPVQDPFVAGVGPCGLAFVTYA